MSNDGTTVKSSDAKLLEALELRWGQRAFRKLRDSRVLIAGAGGLGSNIAMCLTRSGVGSLVLYDFDRVEAANLDRQGYFSDQVGLLKVEALAENLMRVGAGTRIDTFAKKIDEKNVEQIIADADIVVEAFDDAQAKAILTATAAAAIKPVVAASGIAGLCNAAFPRVRLIGLRTAVVGDETSAVSSALPAISSRVAASAALQADLVLQWITEGHFGKNGN